MTTKTLGQVLYEADNIGRERYMKPYDTLCESTRQEFEASASAVAAVERERIASWVESQHDFIPATGAIFAAAIRSMKS